MAKGKGRKDSKVKTAASKQGRGTAKAQTGPSGKHETKPSKSSDIAPTAAPPTLEQGVAGGKVVGFTNLGNTCFFNSVLQVLVASPPLQQFFSQANAKSHQGPLGGAMQELFDQTKPDPEEALGRTKGEDKPSKAKKQKQRGCYAPQRLLTAVCKLAPHFKGFQQQDSHELLRVLLDGLQTEEAKAIAAQLKHESPQQQAEGEGEGTKVAPPGFLSEIFGGQLSSRVACEVCHHTSITLEPFMDLSLPIPAGTLAGMTDAPDRRGKKAPKAKKSRKGEDESADTLASAVPDAAQPGIKLKAKQRKKLLKEERKASKLERKKQAKQGSPAGPMDQGSAGPSHAAPPTSASPSAAQATNREAAQPSQTDCSQEGAGQGVEDRDTGMGARGGIPSISPGASDQSQEAHQAPRAHQSEEHPQLVVNTASSEAEPHDVLQEFESLSPVLPAMPKEDTHDDLAGLFQAAFATCHKEMSPRGRPPQSPFSSHGQDHEEEDYSLYNDADEVMGDDEAEGTALDASDEEEGEENGEAAGALLESFMGDAEHAAQLQASYNAQADEGEEACTNIGSLFDESVTEAADSAHFQDFGAADEAHLTDEQATTSGEAKLQSCLAEFFQQEQISWECPAEKERKRELRRNSLGNDASPATPSHQSQEQQPNGKRESRHSVSFSEEQPVVTLIPGSVEQRGQVFRTSHGDPPFCRPLRLGGAYVLLTTAPDVRRPTRMLIKIQPQDDKEATLLLASNIRHLATADVPAPKVGDDEEEVRLAQAQVLMDCTADLLSQKGLDGTRAWCEGGVKLRCRSSGHSSSWVVLGQLPEDAGEGQWEYPSPTDPSQHPADGELDPPPSQDVRTPLSSSSSSASVSSSDRRDSASLDSMLGMITSHRHTHPTPCNSHPSSSTTPTHTEQSQSEQGSTIANPSDGGTSDKGCSSAAAASRCYTGIESPQHHHSDASNSAGGTDSVSPSSTSSSHSPPGLVSPAAPEAASVTVTDAGHAGAPAAHAPSLAQSPAAVMLPPTDQKEGAAPGRTESRDPSQANPSGEPPLREAAPRDEAAPGDEGAPSDEAKSVDGEHEDRQTRTANGGAGSEGEQADTPNGHHGLSISQAASMHQGVNSITDTPITSPKTDEPADGNGGVVDGAASGNESCQSSANGKQQPQQPEQSNGTAGLHGKAPKTPTRKAPKKGGLVNVQRPAVKGYSIHRCPPLLTVHIKRFQQDMRGRLSKIDGAVPFPIDLNLTLYCDPKGPDAGGARYTLLGFVEHLGTMRSGHYVAYVQRGMNDSHSTHLQSLLRKHGLVPQSPPASQDSSSASPAHGKKQKKRSAAKAAAAAAGSDKAAGSSSTSEAGASEHHMAVARDAATPAFDAVATNGVAAEVDGNKAQSSSTVHMNGQTDHQQIVPENWESDNGKSADKSQRDSSAGGPAVGQVHGDSQPTDTGIAEPDTVSDVGPAATLTLSSEGPVVGQPTPPAKEPDTAQVGSRQEAAASSLAEHQSVPGQRSWFYISDSQVKTVSEADILKREAYILLYMRTG